MEDRVRHNLAQLIAKSGISLAAASRAIGRNHAYLQQFLKRGSPRVLDAAARAALAEFFQVPAETFGDAAPVRQPAVPLVGNARPALDQNTQTFAAAAMPRDVPVMGSTVGGTRGDFSLNGEVVDYVRRPPALENTNAFALYVQGDSMWPWRAAGSLVYVHPARPPRIGDHVVVEIHGDGGDDAGEHPCYVKRLVERSPRLLRLGQYNPLREDIVFEMASVRSLYRVLEWEELLGL